MNGFDLLLVGAAAQGLQRAVGWRVAVLSPAAGQRELDLVLDEDWDLLLAWCWIGKGFEDFQAGGRAL